MYLHGLEGLSSSTRTHSAPFAARFTLSLLLSLDNFRRAANKLHLLMITTVHLKLEYNALCPPFPCFANLIARLNL